MKDGRLSAAQIKTQQLRMIGERARHAREEINNMRQGDAAARLGYSNSSYLSKIESGTVSNLSTTTISNMATLYDVSADYLLGLTEEWETAVPRASNQYLVDLLERSRKQDMRVLAKLEKKVNDVMAVTLDVAGAALEAQQALESFIAKCPEIEDMPANKLINRIQKAAEHAAYARSVASRYRTLCRVAAVDSLPLDLEPNNTEA